MQRASIDRLLPAVFRRALPAEGGSPLDAVLDSMVALHRPVEGILETLDVQLDPRRSPIDAMVPYLAGWVDLDYVFLERGETYAPSAGPPLASGLGWLRELVAVGVEIAQWRGTKRGLQLILEAATGVTGFEVDDSSGVAHLRVVVPASAASLQPLVDRIVRAEKPAHLTYELAAGQEG